VQEKKSDKMPLRYKSSIAQCGNSVSGDARNRIRSDQFPEKFDDAATASGVSLKIKKIFCRFSILPDPRRQNNNQLEAKKK
jgi:hypothetical protein